MFGDDLDAFAEVQDSLVRLMRDADAGDWALPSGGCPGWTVGDIFLHLGLTLAQFVDRRSLPRVEGLGTERANDVLVEHRRSWTHEQVFDAYVADARTTLDRMRAIGPDSDVVLDLGDVGRYPFADLVKAYVWDHVTHMTCDVVAPDGPLRRPGPPATERVMGTVVDWIFTALPQQVRDVPAVAGTISLDLRGPGGRQVGLAVRDRRFAVSDAPAGEAVATVTSSTADLLRWATQRRSWRDPGVTVTGDGDAAAPALDVIRVF
ncbi:MAG TPA: maleylpyruvate isomerase N-terminal domain-containing protein [Terriglobales bacterium]|nr:maleylpyruvate isomerase N-terminal domain-containing protein [Terriglobales bacterium]